MAFMAETRADFETQLKRVRSGSHQAVRALLERYKQPIFRVIRRRLHKELRSRYDSEDFVQSVWSSFFAISPDEFAFESPEALQAFLIDMASKKVIEAIRKRATQKRDPKRSKSLDGSARAEARTVSARTPTPSQVVMAKELWANLLEGQPAHHQRILLLLRQGKTHVEIAAELDMSEKSIRRLIKKLAPEFSS
jgi:RNA polymerase sigma factor (sigma-70 family)